MNPTSCRRRRGKVLLFVVISLPAVLAVVGLVFDVGLMAVTKQNLQQASDAAATAAAVELALGKSSSDAVSTAEEYLRVHNALTAADVTVHIPPTTGGYAGRSGFVEVQSEVSYQTKIMQAVGAASQSQIPTRSVAGRLPATVGGAIVALDPTPPPVQIDSIPALLTLNFPALLGGLEVLGAGTVRVDGAVLVNSTWGGVDENNSPAGSSAGPPYGISCTPLLPLTRLNARDIRVAGGVDNPDNYGNFTSGQAAPLKANRLAVPDPLRQVPAPSTASASSLVDTTLRGGVQVVQLPLIVAPTILRPGVYDWIEVLSGSVIFQPGVYIIRSVRPGTNAALAISGGLVQANGVLFYITNSTTYDPTTGFPDTNDDATVPSPPNTNNLTPSVIINGVLPGSSFTPLQATGSPLDGMLIYQRRVDYRPIVVVYQGLLGTQTFDGTIYAKYGHVVFAGDGTHDMRIVAGSIRLLSLLGLTIAPSNPFEPAYDVYLVE
jgi:Flp pilus assembly protein TadG